MKRLFILITLFTLAAVLVCQAAVAAEVTRVNASKGQVYVDGGKPEGFIVGAKVCIYEGSKKLACGNIFRTTDTYSVLRVDSHAARYIDNGMTASLTESEDE